jgi:hypothetical protein
MAQRIWGVSVDIVSALQVYRTMVLLLCFAVTTQIRSLKPWRGFNLISYLNKPSDTGTQRIEG